MKTILMFGSFFISASSFGLPNDHVVVGGLDFHRVKPTSLEVRDHPILGDISTSPTLPIDPPSELALSHVTKRFSALFHSILYEGETISYSVIGYLVLDDFSDIGLVYEIPNTTPNHLRNEFFTTLESNTAEAYFIREQTYNMRSIIPYAVPRQKSLPAYEYSNTHNYPWRKDRSIKGSPDELIKYLIKNNLFPCSAIIDRIF